jgi:aromatic-L-amino-acid/L-tryptophan decarboxylase
MRKNRHHLEDDILRLEADSSKLETDATTRAEYRRVVAKHSEDYLANLSDGLAYSQDGYGPDTADEMLRPGEPVPLEALVDYVEERVNKPGINMTSGGLMGFIPGGGVFESALGDYMAAVANRYAGMFYASPGAVRMENAMIKWAGEVIGYTGAFGGSLTSGGSMANLTAITTARHTMGVRNRDAETTVIYTTKRTHHSVFKALKVSGLHECIMRTIDLDASYRIDVRKLEQQIIEDKEAGLTPFLCIINAGSTDIGAVDQPIPVSKVAQKHGVWLHIDAAYGGFFMLTRWGKEFLKGIEQADSVILDPHKGLFLPYGTGIVLVKKASNLIDTFKYHASYLQDAISTTAEESPTDVSAELSKHFRGMRMWLPLKVHGVAPFRDALDEKLLLTRYLWDNIREMGFETGPYPDLTIVIFRYNRDGVDTDPLNHKIFEDIRNDGRIFLSSTTLDGVFYLRVAILSFRTHKRHIDLLIEMLKKSLQNHLPKQGKM